MAKKFLDWKDKRDYFINRKYEKDGVEYTAIKADFTALAAWEGKAFNAFGDFLSDIVVRVKEVIDESWSDSSPSAPYTPPAIETGYLKNSGQIIGRKSGRFSKLADTTKITLYYTAPYAAAQEKGYALRNLAPRPYFQPAVDKVAQEVEGGVNFGNIQVYWR